MKKNNNNNNEKTAKQAELRWGGGVEAERESRLLQQLR